MQPLTFITFSRNGQFSQELKDALAGNARTRLLADCNKLDQMLAEVMRLRPSAAVVVLEPDRAEKDFAFIKQLAATCPNTTVVTAACDTSPELILNSIRSGAHEFLQLPIVAGEFQTVTSEGNQD